MTDPEQPLRLRVHALVWEAEGVLSVHLRQPDGGDLPPWEPGAHLDLRLPEQGVTRQYSLNGSPDDRSAWRISVLREPASRGGSRAVHESLRPGATVEVTGPRNTFPLADSPQYLFVAGGIGVTPILPMVERVASRGDSWSLLYGGRTRASMAFTGRLARHGGERVLIRPQDEHGLLDLDSFLGEPREGVQVYCCGPEPLLAAVEERCRDWPAGALHTERFTARPRPTEEHDAAEAYEVVLARTGRRLAVPAGRTVLEALEAAGIEPPNSCREGICGTCETKVLGGTPEHRDSLLSEEEQAAGDTMMICVGRALRSPLVLDL